MNYYGVTWSDSDRSSISHYGIKGQKWGERRFQNEDGSYTAEGRKRYGMTGGMPINPAIADPIKIAATTYAVNATRFQIRKHSVRKRIEKSQINKDKERIKKDDIDTLASKYNKKEQNKIIQSMKDDPKKTFQQAEKPVKEERKARIRRNTAIFMAANTIIPMALAFAYANRSKISDKLHRADDAVRRNKVYQSFMKSVKNRKVKNSVVMRSDEYEIDRKQRLPSGRG